MSSNLVLRRLGYVAIGSGAYLGATYFIYNFLTAGQEDQAQTTKKVQEGVSYVKDPCYRHDRFQRIADTYDDMLGRDEFFMGMTLLRWMLLHFNAHGDVLEVGAGTGRNISYYSSVIVRRVLLTDTSDQMLHQAQLKLKKLPQEDRKRFACLKADATHLDFPSNYFDTVVDTFGLCSFDDPIQVLREMDRVCKPNGKILLLEHGRSKTWQWVTNYLDRNAERHAKNWGCVWNRDLDDILLESGLHLERVDTWHFGTTYYIVCRPNGYKYVHPLHQRLLLASSPTAFAPGLWNPWRKL